MGRGSVLEIDLWVTGNGSAKAEEVIRLLGVADVHAAGAVLERSALEVYDVVPAPDPADLPPSGPADVLPLDPVIAAAMKRDEESNQPAGADWGAVRDVAGRQSTIVQLDVNGQRTGTGTLAVLDTTPGLFTADNSGFGLTQARNEDGSPNSDR